MLHDSYWDSTWSRPPSRYPPLTEDCRADVVIVGAGIVGLTAAESLIRAGKSVVVLEARHVGGQATGRSTAKITSQHGLIYQTLIDDFGVDMAALYAQANQGAVNRIRDLIAREDIQCALETKSSYLLAHTRAEAEALEQEARAQRLGLPARLCDAVPAPLDVKKALAFDDQAQFNPVHYLAGLAAVVARKARVHEQSRVMEVEHGDPRCVRTENGCLVRAHDVIIATHAPIITEGLFFSRIYPWSHPMIAAPVEAEHAPDGMFISFGHPGRSFRIDRSRGAPYLIAVGASYRPGNTEEERHCFTQIEDYVREVFGIQEPAYRWTNEDFQSMDGVPFVGHATTGSPHLYVATGFNAWGITNGTAGGDLLADLICARRNPYARMFHATRIKPVTGGVEFFKKNAGVAERFVRGRYLEDRPHRLELKPGEGGVATLRGEPVAGYRDEAGQLHAVSAICSHLGCVVGWNAADRTWDCPCHGSRFDYDGAVLSGPATEPLKPFFKT